MGQMLTLEEAAKVMNVSARTVKRMIDRGDIEATRMGTGRGVLRIAPTAINALTGQPVVKNGNGGGALQDPARRLAVAVLGEALPLFKRYCEQTGKEIQDLTADDLQKMV